MLSTGRPSQSRLCSGPEFSSTFFNNDWTNQPTSGSHTNHAKRHSPSPPRRTRNSHQGRYFFSIKRQIYLLPSTPYVSFQTRSNEAATFRAIYKMTDTENIFIFVPNIIGYGRVILALVSFYFMPTNYVVSSWCYIISGLLDAVDGHAARYFNQSTRFGAILDQLTDRVGTMCLCLTLAQFYPAYTFWFQLSTAIDIACHWIYLHTTLLQGKTSHKFLDMSENPIMRVYYTNRQVLFLMCAGNEAFYAALYLLHFTEGPILAGISIFRAVLYISTPIAIVKSLISVLHGYVACINLSIIDVKEREAQRKAR